MCIAARQHVADFERKLLVAGTVGHRTNIKFGHTFLIWKNKKQKYYKYFCLDEYFE